jgi:hypothetical protein
MPQYGTAILVTEGLHPDMKCVSSGNSVLCASDLSMLVMATYSWSLLNDLLMSALDTAVTFKQMNIVTMMISKNLHLNMSWFHYKSF